jgi:hypothetical protein
MENIIEIRKDRVLVEINGEYVERPIKTLEKQREEQERFEKMARELG